MKYCLILLLLLVTACFPSYTSKQHLCGDFYLVEHEGASGHSLIQQTDNDELSILLIEGNIAELSGNCDYIFATQFDDIHLLYYIIETHYPRANQLKPVAKADFDTKLSNQNVAYHYSFSGEEK